MAGPHSGTRLPDEPQNTFVKMSSGGKLEEQMHTAPRESSGNIAFLYCFIFISIFVRVAFTGPLLNLFMRYSRDGGSFIERIHPGIYLLILTFFLVLLKGKLYPLLAFTRENASSLIHYLVASAGISVISVLLKGTSGMAYLINTHLSAAAFGILVLGCSDKQKEIVKNTILIVILINSLVAIGEFIFHHNLIRYYTDSGGLFSRTGHSFRSQAFFGHSLMNALITVSSLFFIFTTKWNAILKIIFSTVFILALLCFAGRIATLIGFMIVGYFLINRFFHDFKRRTKFLEVSIFIFGFPLLVFIIFILVNDLGMGARLFEQDLLDHSGMTRIRLFSVFSQLSTSQLLRGMSPDDMALLISSKLGLRTIENFWVLFVLILGVPAAIILGSLLIRMLFCLSLRQQTAGKLGALSFILVASTNNSLATKSVALTIVVMLLVTNCTPSPAIKE